MTVAVSTNNFNFKFGKIYGGENKFVTPESLFEKIYKTNDVEYKFGTEANFWVSNYNSSNLRSKSALEHIEDAKWQAVSNRLMERNKKVYEALAK